jgi:hypothetical protein
MSTPVDPDSEPTPEEFAAAVRALMLSPQQQRRHPSALKADHRKLDHVNTYGDLPTYYIDQPFECRDCGKRQIWRAAAQKQYYEERKGHIDAKAVRCRQCRRK